MKWEQVFQGRKGGNTIRKMYQKPASMKEPENRPVEVKFMLEPENERIQAIGYASEYDMMQILCCMVEIIMHTTGKDRVDVLTDALLMMSLSEDIEKSRN